MRTSASQVGTSKSDSGLSRIKATKDRAATAALPNDQINGFTKLVRISETSYHRRFCGRLDVNIRVRVILKLPAVVV